MGFVLHLSLAGHADAEGWTPQEISECDVFEAFRTPPAA
jgi:hypothetical protein